MEGLCTAASTTSRRSRTRSASSCRPDYSAKKFQGHQVPVHGRQRGDRHVYRGVKPLRGGGQGDQAATARTARRSRPRRWTSAKLAEGPGGGAEMVPGKMHCEDEHVHRGVQEGRRGQDCATRSSRNPRWSIRRNAEPATGARGRDGRHADGGTGVRWRGLGGAATPAGPAHVEIELVVLALSRWSRRCC